MDQQTLSKLEVDDLSNLLDELTKYHKQIYEVLKNKDEYVHVSTDSDYKSSTEEESEEESEEELESVKEEYKIDVDNKGFYSLRDCVVKLENFKEVLLRD